MRDLIIMITSEVKDERVATQKITALAELLERYGFKVEAANLSPEKALAFWEP